jgi:hypothetical protein
MSGSGTPKSIAQKNAGAITLTRLAFARKKRARLDCGKKSGLGTIDKLGLIAKSA